MIDLQGQMIMMKKMLITAVLGLAMCCTVLIYFMISMPDGQYIGSVSLGKKAKINVYLVSPALSDDAVRCASLLTLVKEEMFIMHTTGAMHL